ncbi:hypothetical protein HYALB_00013774 [Hymenoscyphus albidus]|uniref:Uncharacterized protein n=1 Tax=Hymenoscyphus albidus TaxID=595503 RepID=A0A9N9LX71_9HELO|nr:hypothetical protein HYALB_00013774 [Hymenoscyphus albidus]
MSSSGKGDGRWAMGDGRWQSLRNLLSSVSRIPTEVTLILQLGIKERRHCNDNIRRTKQRTFQIITPSIQDEEINNECRDEQGDRFKEGEVEGHLFTHGPTEKNDEGSDEECWDLLVVDDGKE